MSDKPAYEDLEKEIEDLRRENRSLKLTEERNIALNHLAGALLHPGPLDDKLKLITEKGVEIFDADFFRIWMVREGDLCDSGCIHSEVKKAHMSVKTGIGVFTSWPVQAAIRILTERFIVEYHLGATKSVGSQQETIPGLLRTM